MNRKTPELLTPAVVTVSQHSTAPLDTAESSFDIPFANQDIVITLRNRLGDDVVLLPITQGTKFPNIKGWQQKTITDMECTDYVASLKKGNIGVLLGDASGGLCTIDIDDDDAVETFLELNPRLRDTLRSKGARGQQIWLRITSRYPALTKLTTITGDAWGEWRSTGGQSVIHGLHPSGNEYRFVNEAAPIAIRFDEIVWPDTINPPEQQEAAVSTEVNTEPPAYVISESGVIQINQMHFANLYVATHDIKFDQSTGEFVQYDGDTGLWQIISTEHIKRSILATLTKLAKDDDIPMLHFKLIDGLATGIVNLIRIKIAEEDVFANRPEAIHVRNGMLVFANGELELRTFSPEYLSRNMCPYDYDGDADCPRFKAELLGTALGADDIRLMQKWVGSCLLGRNITQRFMLILGTPGGGKSTLMTILESVIGLRNVMQLRTECLENRFELSRFVGKTLLMGKDVPSDFMLQKGTSKIKALVGGDFLSGEIKGQQKAVTLRGEFNIGITCNADLNIRLEGDLKAWSRRMLTIRYEKPAPARKIPNFAEHLLIEEGTGILKWMIEGAMMLMEDIEKNGDYALTAEQINRTNGILAQSDSVRYFVENCVRASPIHSLTSRQLREGYLDCCQRKNWVPIPDSEITKDLATAMTSVHRSRVRHDVGPNGSQRGYNHFRVQLEGDGNAQD